MTPPDHQPGPPPTPPRPPITPPMPPHDPPCLCAPPSPDCCPPYGRPTEQQKTRQKPVRFREEAVVCQNTYRDRTEAELREDFCQRGAGVPAFDFDRYLQAFCNRKYDSDFSREMSRSAAVYLQDFE